MAKVNTLITIADREVGYLEKESNKDLDKKVANAGDKNYTKYSRDLIEIVGKPFQQAVYWCVIFVTWCVVSAYGEEKAKELLHVWTMSCGTLMDTFKQFKGGWQKEPKAGDLVIFEWTSKGVLKRHIGIVYKVDKNYIYTIEGNTSGISNTVIENGGGVFKKSYLRTNSRIKGYCRPKYDNEVKTKIAQPTLKKGDKGNEVKLLQSDLNSAINAKLTTDGSFGTKTEQAVKNFQKKYKLAVDGSYGPATYKKLKEVLNGE